MPSPAFADMLPLAADHVAWTRESFTRWFRSLEFDERIIVLSNREPVCHEFNGSDAPLAVRGGSGVVNAVEPLIRATSGVWVAAAGGSADRLVPLERDGLPVPSGAPEYRLRRVWLTPEEQQGYYAGCANEALWPLFHRAHVKPVFRSDDLSAYWSVNARFADAVCEEATNVASPTHAGTTGAPVVLVQDYHFALVPVMLRERLPRSTIVTFWHIPWVDWRTFQVCPWRDHLLEGLLGSDIIGFQTAADCHNFLETVARWGEVHVDREQGIVTYQRHRVRVREYAASVEWDPERERRTLPVWACRAAVRRELALPAHVRLGVGVDRLDYTKGIEEKFLAIERLFECFPDIAGRFAFVQLAQPTRGALPVYRDLRSRVRATADRINRRFGEGDYRPILLLEGNHGADEIDRYFRAADVCYVNSLHDGMNLVSKEFARARDDLRGVLVMSEFAGAARDLPGAVLVNPYDLDESARALAGALGMPEQSQRERMRQMREHVAEFSAHRWGARILADVIRLRQGDRHLGATQARMSAG